MNQQNRKMTVEQNATDNTESSQNDCSDHSKLASSLSASSANDLVLADLMSNDFHVPKIGSLIYNRIFVKGLPMGTSLCDIHMTFSQYGQVIQTKLIVDRNGNSKGYGFVTFTSTDDALNVLREKESVFVNGKRVIVGPAVRKPSRKYHAWLKRKRSTFNMNYNRLLTERATQQPQVFLLNTLIPTNQYYLTTMQQPDVSNCLSFAHHTAANSFTLPSQNGQVNSTLDFDENCACCFCSLCAGADGGLANTQDGGLANTQDGGLSNSQDSTGITRSATTIVTPYEPTDSPDPNLTDASLTSGSLHSDCSDRCSCCENISTLVCTSQLHGFSAGTVLLQQPSAQCPQVYGQACSASFMGSTLPNVQQVSPCFPQVIGCPPQQPSAVLYPSFGPTGQAFPPQSSPVQSMTSNVIPSFVPGIQPLIYFTTCPVAQ